MQKDLLRSLLTATKGIRVGSGTGRRRKTVAARNGARRGDSLVQLEQVETGDRVVWLASG
jgi:hypothetical protein